MLSVTRTLQRVALGVRSECGRGGHFHLRRNKIVVISGAKRKFHLFAWLREIREEWRENDRANQPMNNNPGEDVEDVSMLSLFKQSPRTHLKIIKETLDLYRLTLVDRDESVRLIKIDEEILRQLRRARSSKAEAAAAADKSSPDVENLANKVAHMQTDAAEVARRVREMFPKDMPTDAASALEAIKARKGDANDLAVDRLEVMGASISEFMAGYREGKEEGIAQVNGPEGIKYFASLSVDEPLNDRSSDADAVTADAVTADAVTTAAAAAAAQESVAAPESMSNLEKGSDSAPKARSDTVGGPDPV